MATAVVDHVIEPELAERPVPLVRVLGVPSAYLPHGRPDAILAELGLDGAGIAAEVRRLLRHRHGAPIAR